MKLHTVGRHHLVEGDCVEVLRAMPDDCFDACVSDPPYGLGFMGKAWDCDVPGADFAAELFRTLKPGAHACLFGGTRTFHRLAVALEDAGFEIRDCLSWLYGTGFPKSLDVSKAIDAAAGATREVIGIAKGAGSTNTESLGAYAATYAVTYAATDAARQWNGWGTALKPAWEPVLLIRKPLIGTVAANVLAHGTGGLNIDATRIGSEVTTTWISAKGFGPNMRDSNWAPDPQARAYDNPPGRWPANVVLDEVAAELLDAQSGERTSGIKQGGQYDRPIGVHEGRQRKDGTTCYGDTGGASRFFYVAKPSRAERDRGCEALPVRSGGEATDREDDAPGTQSPRAGAGRNGGARNIHPTVKPAALIRWLVQLVTPPGGVVLDPFAGSGTIFLAAEDLDVTVNAIERDPEYVQIAIARGSSAK